MHLTTRSDNGCYTCYIYPERSIDIVNILICFLGKVILSLLRVEGEWSVKLCDLSVSVPPEVIAYTNELGSVPMFSLMGMMLFSRRKK